MGPWLAPGSLGVSPVLWLWLFVPKLLYNVVSELGSLEFWYLWAEGAYVTGLQNRPWAPRLMNCPGGYFTCVVTTHCWTNYCTHILYDPTGNSLEEVCVSLSGLHPQSPH